MNDKKGKLKKLAITVLVLLLVVSAYVAAHPEETKDTWGEMKEIREKMHGDNFEEHHREIHGENWEDTVARCHGDQV